MYHYILVRVEESDSGYKRGDFTNTGVLRSLIHRFARENDIVVADNIIRADRAEFINGQPVPYSETEELFNKIVFKERRSAEKSDR